MTPHTSPAPASTSRAAPRCIESRFDRPFPLHVIACEAKQSSDKDEELDCFVASLLAMTTYSASPAADDLIVQALPFAGVVEHELRIDEGEGDPVEHARNLARRRRKFALEHDLLAVAQH